MSFHAYGLPVNLSGRRYCPAKGASTTRCVRLHVNRVTQLVRERLTRQYWSQQYNGIVEAATASDSSKMVVLALRLQQPGPPVHISLDAVALPSHRAAMASFLCADWFLAKYAKNYFAKHLLPRSAAHMTEVHDKGIEHNVLCMACWHRRREVVLENEFHVTCACPEYAKARSDLTDHLQLGKQLATFAVSANCLQLMTRPSCQQYATFSLVLLSRG